MPIERQSVPYEILIRYDEETGLFKGAHATFLERVVDTDTGEIVATKIGLAQPLATAAGKGLSLADLVAGAQTDAMDRVAVLTAEAAAKDQAIAERDAALAEKDAALAARGPGQAAE